MGFARRNWNLLHRETGDEIPASWIPVAVVLPPHGAQTDHQEHTLLRCLCPAQGMGPTQDTPGVAHHE